jgi:hypothetical protein
MGAVMQKLIGVICLIAGVALLLRGHDIAHSLNSQVKNIFTGAPTNNAVYCFIGGAVLSSVGITLIFLKRK